MPEEIHRGWRIEESRPPIPVRSCDWWAAPVDYDLGDPVVVGPTREDVVAQVDESLEEEA